jgi:hypothetical protein
MLYIIMKRRLKRALSLGGGKGGSSNILFVIGAGAVVALGAWYFLGHHAAADAKANFANSSNSIYPEGGGVDYGDSMNSFVPFHGQSSYIDPVIHGGHRSFPDYTTTSNLIPTPFVEINFPYDSFNRGANLANVIDKCAYVSTYNGNQFSP